MRRVHNTAHLLKLFPRTSFWGEIFSVNNKIKLFVSIWNLQFKNVVIFFYCSWFNMIIFINVEQLRTHTLAGNVQLAQECKQKSQFHSPLRLCHENTIAFTCSITRSSQVEIDRNTTMYVMQRFNQVIKIQTGEESRKSRKTSLVFKSRNFCWEKSFAA